MSDSPQKCRISNIREIFEAIDLALVKAKKRQIKRADWHTVLSGLTENKILPSWITAFYSSKSKFIKKVDAEKVKIALEVYMKSLGIDLEVNMECVPV